MCFIPMQRRDRGANRGGGAMAAAPRSYAFLGEAAVAGPALLSQAAGPPLPACWAKRRRRQQLPPSRAKRLRGRRDHGGPCDGVAQALAQPVPARAAVGGHAGGSPLRRRGGRVTRGPGKGECACGGRGEGRAGREGGRVEKGGGRGTHICQTNTFVRFE